MTSFEIGDRVAADNSELCGHCFYCRRGEPLLCENVRRIGSRTAMSWMLTLFLVERPRNDPARWFRRILRIPPAPDLQDQEP